MDKKYLAARWREEKQSAMGKANVLANSFDDIIKLSIGDPDMNTPELIIEKAFEDAKNGYTHYGDFRGDLELRQEIAKFYKNEYNLDIDGETEVFVTASGTIAMHMTLEAILEEGDEVIIQAPFFTPYTGQVQLAKGVPVQLDTFEDEDFQINPDRLEALITDKTRALIINSPSNPTGNCMTVETMKKLAEIVEKHDIIVISDEIYTCFSFENPFVPFISIPGMRERTITINSFSKNFVMTGWRVGNIVAPDYIIRAIGRINEGVIFTAPAMSQRAAIYALRHMKEIQPPITEEFKKRIYYAAERINKIPNMSVIYPPKGSFYLFPNIKKTGLTSEQVFEKILMEAHVLTLPGNGFGRCGEGYLRLCCTVSIETLKEAFDRIEKMEIFQEK